MEADTSEGICDRNDLRCYYDVQLSHTKPHENENLDQALNLGQCGRWLNHFNHVAYGGARAVSLVRGCVCQARDDESIRPS